MFSTKLLHYTVVSNNFLTTQWIQTYVRNFTPLSIIHAFFSCWLRIRFLRLKERVWTRWKRRVFYWVAHVSTAMIPSHVRQLFPDFPIIFWQRAMDHKLLWIFHNTCQKLYHSFHNTCLLFLTYNINYLVAKWHDLIQM